MVIDASVRQATELLTGRIDWLVGRLGGWVSGRMDGWVVYEG